MNRTILTLLFLCCSVTMGAQEADLDIGSSPSTPSAPTSAEAAAIEEAIQALQSELSDLERQWDAEISELSRQIADRQDEVTRLAETELELRRTYDALGESLFQQDEKRVTAEAELQRREVGFEALSSELIRQANDLRDRFRNSVLILGEPELFEDIGPIATRASLEGAPVEQELETLLGVYDEVLTAAETVTTFDTRVRLTASGGAIDTGEVLRLGLFGAYYTSVLESGFLLAPTEAGGKPEGRAIGLSEEQQAAIANLVSNPNSGGMIPIDVTGGAGLAALDVGDTFLEWFEKGGVFMWPIAIVAALALLMVLERAVVLALKTRGIDKNVRSVVNLIEAGRTEEALRAASRIGGPIGSVLEAALVHSDRDRSVMEDAVQESLLHVQPQLTARLSFIALCAAVAPLMGLLGTVTGMILTFNQVTIFGTSDPRFMAGGISVALITTQGGLYLAIPCLLSRGILGAFADSALGKIETGAMSVVLAILESRAPAEEELDPTPVAEEAPVLVLAEAAEEVVSAGEIPVSGGAIDFDESEIEDVSMDFDIDDVEPSEPVVKG